MQIVSSATFQVFNSAIYIHRVCLWLINRVWLITDIRNEKSEWLHHIIFVKFTIIDYQIYNNIYNY